MCWASSPTSRSAVPYSEVRYAGDNSAMVAVVFEYPGDPLRPRPISLCIRNEEIETIAIRPMPGSLSQPSVTSPRISTANLCGRPRCSAASFHQGPPAPTTVVQPSSPCPVDSRSRRWG
jgi:hypothetical protein